MSDDKTNRGTRDGKRVNIHEDYEVRYWTKRFGVTRERLEQAVKKVGPMVTNIEKELR